MTIRTKKIEPRAGVLIESMRDIGYSLPTAIADIIDNSLTANADKIELFAKMSEEPVIAVLDNGVGMTEEKLYEAMRPGTKSPREKRAKDDFGRFGLGLKTASFSQCRRLTVLSRKKGKVTCAVWDLDLVVEKNEWLVEIPDDTAGIPWAEKLAHDGTLVVWEKLDRLTGGATDKDFNRQLSEMSDHIELVFHRILSGEVKNKKVVMTLNGRDFVPFDPFFLKHPATQKGRFEALVLDGERIEITPFTLPHHKKVSETEWNRYGGKEGYLRNQGFYLYRNKRLIIHGTWFHLARQTELTKLSRVQIDVSNYLDIKWKIDVKKASAQLPIPVRNRLKGLIEKIGADSKRVYDGRGARLASKSQMPVWIRNKKENEIIYGINTKHPLMDCFAEDLDGEKSLEFHRLIDLIASSLPIDSLFADMGDLPQDVSTQQIDKKHLSIMVKHAVLTLHQKGLSREIITAMMLSSEPFASNQDEVTKLLDTHDWNNIA